jgi:hypothetical protein
MTQMFICGHALMAPGRRRPMTQMFICGHALMAPGRRRPMTQMFICGRALMGSTSEHNASVSTIRHP